MIKKYLQGVFYGWWIVFACFFVAFYVAGSIFFGFTAFLDPIVTEFGWSYTQISLVAALRGLNMGIFAPLAGFLTDRYGSRKMIAFGTLTVSAGLILMGFTDSFLWFFGCIFLISIGAGGCTSVVLMSVIANWFRSHVGKAMGIVACGFGAGGALVPLNVWLVDSFSWRTASIIIGLGMLASGIPALIVIRNDPRKYGYLPDGKIPDPLDSDLGETEKHSDPQFRDALRNRIYWLLNISEAFRMMVVTAVVMHVMPYLGSLGMDRFRAGLVASAIPLISIFGRIGFGWLGDIVSKQKVIAVCLAFTAIGLIAFSNAETRWFILPFLFFFSPGFGGNTSLRGAIIQDHFGTNSFGKLLGITMGISSIGGFLGPTLAGWSFDNLGGYQIMWQLFSIAVAACAVFMFFVKPTKAKAI